MPRNYRHIKEYEKKLNKLKEEGFTENQIGEKLGFSFKQVHNFFTAKESINEKLLQE